MAETCHCAEGWTCEKHPDQPWPHGDCPGPGEQCHNPACPWWKGPKPSALDTSDWTHVTPVDSRAMSRKPN
jgi:hypothetical protein